MTIVNGLFLLQNALLREKSKEIESLEQHCSKLQNQVADSRMTDREKRALQCKLQMAENMLRQKVRGRRMRKLDIRIL